MRRLLAAAAAGLAALSLAGCASAPRGPYVAPSDERLDAQLRRIHDRYKTVPERVQAVSALFVGAPYKLGPLGEGPDGEFDRDPLMRLDVFDCTTFVETMTALALERGVAAARETLQKIRYQDGQVGFAARNHFTELDWVPRNVWAGYLRDVTEDAAGEKTVRVSKVISKREWYAKLSTAAIEGRFTPEERLKRLPKLRALGGSFEDKHAALAAIPLSDLPAALSRVPSGSIANLVRTDQPGKETIVSHQVLLIRGDDGWIVRHAAFGKAVEDVPLESYLKRYEGSSWPLTGLNVVVPRDPRQSELRPR